MQTPDQGVTGRAWLPIAVICAAALALNVAYSLAVLPWLGPDEPRHVEYVLLLAEKGRLVTWADAMPAIEQRIIESMDQNYFWYFGQMSEGVYKPGTMPARFDQIWSPGLSHELHQPPLYYLLLAPLAVLTQGFNVATQDHLMRLVSALLATGTVLLTWLAAREAFPEDRLLAPAAAAFVAFLPMHSFMAGVVNNDVLAEVLGAAVVCILVRGVRRGFSLPLIVAALMAVALCLLAKRTAVPLLFLLGWAVLLRLARSTRWPVWWGVVAGLVSIAGLFWAVDRYAERLQQLRMSLPPAIGSLLFVYLLYPIITLTGQAGRSWLPNIASRDAISYYQRWLTMLFETFWARFGWVNVRIGEGFYAVLYIVSLLALAGAAVVVWEALRGRRPRVDWQRDEVILLAGGIVFGLVVLVFKMVQDWDAVPRVTTQARFLFPVLAPVAIMFVMGLRRLFPPRFQRTVVFCLVGGMLVLNVIALSIYIVPFYHHI